MKISKKVLTGLFLAYILFPSILSLSADSLRFDLKKDRDEARLMNLVLSDANEFLRREYGEVLPALKSGDFYPPSIFAGGELHEANYSLYQRYKLIIYWSGKDLKKINPQRKDRIIALAGDPFYAEGETIYRYLGYDFEGKRLHNPQFPSDSYEKNPRYTLKQPQKKNFWKAIIEKDAALRDQILANFNKSWLEEIDDLIEVYFKYRSLSQGADREVYKRNHRRHIAKLIREGQVDARHINLISLPTDRLDGIAEYENSYNFYKAIVLKYQSDTDQRLEIRHLAVESCPEAPGAYRVTDRLSGIRQRDFRRIGVGETKNISAKLSQFFSCIGYRIFQSEEEFLRILGREKRRKRFDQYVKAESFVYRYEPKFVNEVPIVVFFYLKNPKQQDENPNGSIEISSDEYEVSHAIPSDEKVRIRVYSDRAVLAAYDAKLREEEVSVDLCFVQTLTMEDEKGRKKKERVEERLETLTRTYSVHELNYYKVFHLKEALVRNKNLNPLFPISLPCREIGESEAKVYADHVAKIDIPKTLQGRRLSLGYGREEGEAPYKVLIHLEEEDDYLSSSELEAIVSDLEREMKIEIRNDFLKIDGTIVLDDTPSLPDRLSSPADYAARAIVLEKPMHLIDALTQNGIAETEGSLVYEKILDSEEEDEVDRIVPILGNDVSVHTPAGSRMILKRADAFDQRPEEKKQRMAVPLDHIMELELLSDVQHIDEKGYGLRDYQKHLKGKSLRFGFDAYVSFNRKNLEETLPEAKYFVKADEALSFSPEKKRVYYKAAPWVKEGVYSITGISLAKNALLHPVAEKGANLHKEHYAAFDRHHVQVAGRLFDFALERVCDPAFLSEAAGDFYSSGPKNKESLPRRRFAGKRQDAIEKRILPVCAGKTAAFPKIKRDVKMGYPFVFSVKSMGSYFAKKDLLILKPHFYHLEDGKINERIALYYSFEGRMLPLDAEGAAGNLVHRNLLLPREMPELIYSLGLLKEADGRNDSMDYEEYAYLTSKPVFCYEPKIIVLSAPLRTFIGPDQKIPEEVDPNSAKMSVQRWRGIYALPSTTQVFALDEAGKADLKKPLSRGSLGIYFEIGLARNRNLAGFDLNFVNRTANQYLNEGYRSDQGKRNFLTGTAILYSLEHRADEDWKEE